MSNIYYVHTNEKEVNLILQARRIVKTCNKYNHPIPKFIMVRAGQTAY